MDLSLVMLAFHKQPSPLILEDDKIVAEADSRYAQVGIVSSCLPRL